MPEYEVTIGAKSFTITSDHELTNDELQGHINTLRATQSQPDPMPQVANSAPSRSSLFGQAPKQAPASQNLFSTQTPAPQPIAPQRPVQPQQNIFQQALAKSQYAPGVAQPPKPPVNVQPPKLDFTKTGGLVSAPTTTSRLPFNEADLMASLRDGVSAVRGLNGQSIPIGNAISMYQAAYGKPPAGFGQTTDDQQARQFATNYGQSPIKGETPSLGAEFTPQRVGKVIKGLTDIPFGLTKDALRLGFQVGGGFTPQPSDPITQLGGQLKQMLGVNPIGESPFAGQNTNLERDTVSQLGDKLNLALGFVGLGPAYLAQIGGSFIEPSMQSLQDGTIDPFVSHIKALGEGLNPLESTKTTSEKIEAAGMLALIMFGVVHGTKGLARANTILKPLEREFGLTRQQTLNIYNTVREGMVKGNQEALGTIRGSITTLTDGINPARMREMMRPIASNVSNPDSFAAWTRAQNSTLPGIPPATQGQPVVQPNLVQPEAPVAEPVVAKGKGKKTPTPVQEPAPVESPNVEAPTPATEPPAQPKPGVKELWQMTRDEWADSFRKELIKDNQLDVNDPRTVELLEATVKSNERDYYNEIEKAFEKGKDIPPDVLQAWRENVGESSYLNAWRLRDRSGKTSSELHSIDQEYVRKQEDLKKAAPEEPTRGVDDFSKLPLHQITLAELSKGHPSGDAVPHSKATESLRTKASQASDAAQSTWQKIRGEGKEWDEATRDVRYLKADEASASARRIYDLKRKAEIDNAHYKAVESALKEGKPVPAEVLADYPDLAKKYKPTPAEKAPAKESVDAEGKPYGGPVSDYSKPTKENVAELRKQATAWRKQAAEFRKNNEVRRGKTEFIKSSNTSLPYRDLNDVQYSKLLEQADKYTKWADEMEAKLPENQGLNAELKRQARAALTPLPRTIKFDASKPIFPIRGGLSAERVHPIINLDPRTMKALGADAVGIIPGAKQDLVLIKDGKVTKTLISQGEASTDNILAALKKEISQAKTPTPVEAPVPEPIRPVETPKVEAKAKPNEAIRPDFENAKAQHPNVSSTEDKYLKQAIDYVAKREAEAKRTRTKLREDEPSYQLLNEVHEVRRGLNYTDEAIRNMTQAELESALRQVEHSVRIADANRNVSIKGKKQLVEIRNQIRNRVDDFKYGRAEAPVETPKVEAKPEAPKPVREMTREERAAQRSEDLKSLFLDNPAGSGIDWVKKSEQVGRIIHTLILDGIDNVAGLISEFKKLVPTEHHSPEMEAVIRSEAKKLGIDEAPPQEVLPKTKPTIEGEGPLSGVANRVNEARADAGEINPIEKGHYIPEEDLQALGKRLVDGGIDPEQHLKTVEKQKGGATHEDYAILTEGQKQLASKSREIASRLDRVTDPELRTKIRKEYDAAIDKETQYLQRVQKLKTATGQAFKSLDVLSSKIDLANPADAIAQAKRMSKTGEIPAEVQKSLTDRALEIDRLQKALDEKDAQLKALQDKALKDQIEKQSRSFTKRRATHEQLDKEYQDLLSQLTKSVSSAKSQIIPGLDPEMVPIVGKLVRNRVLKGVATIQDAVDEVVSTLKANGIHVSERDVRDAFSGYGKDPIHITDLQKQLNDARLEAQLISKLEDMQAGEAVPSRSKSSKASPQVEALREQIKAIEGPKEMSYETKLKMFKKRTEQRIADMEEQLRTGDFTVGKKEPLKLDAEATRLKEEADALREEVGRAKRKQADEIANQQPGTFWDRFRNYARTMALSGVGSFGNIGSAIAGHGVITPFEEAFTHASLRPLLKNTELGKKAGTELYGSVKGEAQAAKAYISPDTFKDAWQKITNKGGSLDAQAEALGLDVHSYRKVNPILTFEQNSHGAMKTWTERNAFAREWVKQTQKVLREGGDINDPVTRVDMFAKSYLKSKEAIMQNDSAASDLLKKVINAAPMLKPLVPVAKVGINIAGRSLEYQHGLVYGTAKLIKNALTKTPLTEAEATKIIQAYKRGGVGAGLMVLAANMPSIDVDDHGQLSIDGHKMPKALSHVPWVNMLITGVHYRKARDAAYNIPTSYVRAALSSARETGMRTPFYDVPEKVNAVAGQPWELSDAALKALPSTIGNLLKGFIVPVNMSQYAKARDTQNRPEWYDAPKILNNIFGTGDEPIKRVVPRTGGMEDFFNQLKTGVTGLRETLPSGANGKKSSSSREPSDGPKRTGLSREPRS